MSLVYQRRQNFRWIQDIAPPTSVNLANIDLDLLEWLATSLDIFFIDISIDLPGNVPVPDSRGRIEILGRIWVGNALLWGSGPTNPEVDIRIAFTGEGVQPQIEGQPPPVRPQNLRSGTWQSIGDAFYEMMLEQRLSAGRFMAREEDDLRWEGTYEANYVTDRSQPVQGGAQFVDPLIDPGWIASIAAYLMNLPALGSTELRR